MSNTFGINCSTNYRNEFCRRIRTNKVAIKVNYLGVVRADPVSYMKQYGDSLIESDALPEYVKQIPTPPGIELVSQIVL